MISWADACLGELACFLLLLLVLPFVLPLVLVLGLISTEIGVCWGDGVARSMAHSGPTKIKK